MTTKSLLAIAAATSLLAVGAAESKTVRGRPNCPEYVSTHNWTEYFQGKYGDTTAPASIKFDGLKTPMGSLMPNTCYTVVYEGGQWTTVGQDNGGGNGNIPHYGGADPGQKIMNIRGNILKFNDAGKVMDKDLNEIGTLKCAIGPEC
jgi:hypothetical protein